MIRKLKQHCILLIIAGVGLGVYAGLVWAFIGGIVDVIQAVKAVEVEAMAVAIGLQKLYLQD